MPECNKMSIDDYDAVDWTGRWHIKGVHNGRGGGIPRYERELSTSTEKKWVKSDS